MSIAVESSALPAAQSEDSVDEPALGRTRVTAKALTSLAAAVAATALDVPTKGVRATVTDVVGRLGVHVYAPITIPPLLSPRSVDRHGTVVERVERARSRIAVDFSALSGREVGRVLVEITGAVTVTEERVS